MTGACEPCGVWRTPPGSESQTRPGKPDALVQGGECQEEKEHFPSLPLPRGLTSFGEAEPAPLGSAVSAKAKFQSTWQAFPELSCWQITPELAQTSDKGSRLWGQDCNENLMSNRSI